MKKKKNAFIAWFWLLVIIIAVTGLIRHFSIKNFQTIKQDVLYVSGQPRGMDYTRLLYKYHIATIVNVRSANEHRERNWHNEEVTWIKDNGVKYIELPIEKHGPVQGIPDANTTAKFLAIMSESSNLPVLIHGSSGTKREIYLAAAWMLKSGGFTLEQTTEKVKQINNEPLTPGEMEFLQSMAK
ncbi:MAG: dual specificity protein phosphatase family protein [Phycisphaerae bacterium]|nr:dual specificity protein phosphatase family protein [Phycisphaerae bacterium]